MKNATFRQLRVFTEVARQLSFAKAARALHLTPPAVTMQVKDLEAQIGLPLFERNGRQVSLTTPGEYMLVYARKLLSVLKDAEDAAARLKRAEAGTLAIGMVSTAKYFLPRLLAEFRVEHPGVEIRLSEGNREELVRLLQANEVDIAVMGRPPRERMRRPMNSSCARKARARARRWRASSPKPAWSRASPWRCPATRRSSRP